VRVVVASGGLAVGGVDFADAELVQLPAVRSPDSTFRTLVDADGEPIGEHFLGRRAALLSELLSGTRPDAILTELYPFGRRKFRLEVDRMLEEAKAKTPRPLVASSVRDILEPATTDAQIAFAVTRLRDSYDLVLIHGDPDFVALDRSFPLPEALGHLSRYTGYIGGAGERAGGAGRTDGAGEIVVSAGGGVVGQALYDAAVEAGALPTCQRWPWRVLVGRNAGTATFDRLAAAAGANVTVEWARPDFPALLHRAAVSVSQAGYTTAADLLDAAVPAVLDPFADGGEQEQTIRAQVMAEAGRAVVLRTEDLSASCLAAAVTAALAPSPDVMRLEEQPFRPMYFCGHDDQFLSPGPARHQVLGHLDHGFLNAVFDGRLAQMFLGQAHVNSPGGLFHALRPLPFDAGQILNDLRRETCDLLLGVGVAGPADCPHQSRD
jgi:predicted glycosyltransferase